MHVEIGEDFPYQLKEAEDWFVEVFEDEFNANSDWFDLDLGVVVDGKRVSLVEPLARLIANRPQLMDELRLLPAEERVPLPLDDRHVLPVPVERMRAWLGPLLESPARMNGRGCRGSTPARWSSWNSCLAIGSACAPARAGPPPARFLGHRGSPAGARLQSYPAHVSAGRSQLAAISAQLRHRRHPCR